MQNGFFEWYRRLRPAGMVLATFALVLACYWPALHGALLWDDPAHVTRPDLRSWAGLARIWFEPGATQQYYPVLHSAFWVEHRLWGDRTIGYHLANIFLHALSCCLLAWALRRAWPDTGAVGGNAAGAKSGLPPGFEWLAAWIFAVHPVCAESVAWISEQKNTLSLAFYLAAGIAYLNFSKRRRLGSYLGASVLFGLAIGTKTVTATIPAALLLVLWWRQGRLGWKRDIAPLIPWFVAAAVAGLCTAWIERRLIGAEGGSFELTALQRVLLASRVVWFYLAKLVWPVDLAFFYERWDVAAATARWIGYLGAAIAVTAALWALRRRARGPLVAWLFFVGSLFPALGFFNVYPFLFSYVADHFQYLACAGFSAAAAGGLAIALAKLRRPIQLLLAGMSGAALVALAVLAHGQSRLYVDNVTLFREAVARTPGSWMAHHILANALSKLPGHRAEAIAEYEDALRLSPDYPDSHLGLAVELSATAGRESEAIAHYQRAIQLRPQYIEARNDLGIELAKTPGRLPEAIAQYEIALRLNPNFAEAHLNLANALIRIPGRQEEAFTQFADAIRIKPDSAQAHRDFGRALSGVPGRQVEAIAQLEEAWRLRPDYLDALNGAAVLYAREGRFDEARARWEKALQIAPDYEEARKNLRVLDQIAAGRH